MTDDIPDGLDCTGGCGTFSAAWAKNRKWTECPMCGKEFKRNTPEAAHGELSPEQEQVKDLVRTYNPDGVA